MIIEEILNTISETNAEDVKLYLVTRKKKDGIARRARAKDKYLFKVYQIDCDDELRETIFESTQEELEKTIRKNYEMVDYDILSDDTENLFTYPIANKVFSFSDVVTNQLFAKNISKVTSLSEIINEEESLWAYCVEFFHTESNNKTFTFRKILPSKVYVDEKSNNFLRAKFSTKSKKLTLLKYETVNLDYQIDCIFHDDIFFVIKKASFEQILGLFEEYKERASEVVQKMINSGNFIGTDKLEEQIEKKPSIHKKLLKVEKIGSYSNLTPDSINIMCDICKKYSDNLLVKNGKLLIQSERDVDIVLRALADYYKIGEISGKAYGTFSGRELVDTTRKNE